MTAYLNQIACAVPPHDIHAAFGAVAHRLLPDPRQRALFQRMVARCGIEHRWSTLRPGVPGALDQDGFYRWGAFPDTLARMRWFERHAPPLAEAAVAPLDPARVRRWVTHVVVATCTGFYAPGLDLQLIERLGLDPGVERTVIGFMGCYAAINALKLARHIVRSEPRACVLVLALELGTLHLQERSDLEAVLSFLIFGDGCAAALVSAAPAGIALDGFRAVVVPDTADQITWRIGNQGFDMVLAGTVPHRLGTALEQALPAILGGRPAAAIALWAVHPGGRSVLDAVEQACGLNPERLADSRAILAGYGNMSSATVLFVLHRMLARAEAGTGVTGPGCALAFGPGLTAETMSFRLIGGAERMR